METNEERDRTRPPETPEGYEPPREFRYPTVGLLLGSVVLTFAAAIAFGVLLWTLQGPDLLETVLHVQNENDGFAFAVDGRMIGVALLTIVVTLVVHEGVHGVVYGLLGYHVSYGIEPRLGAFYAAAFGQFQTRADNLRVALAPLAVITLVAIPLLAAPVPAIAVAALVALIVNTGGAVGDLYAAWRIDHMSPGTLFYDVDIRHFYVFEPLDA